VLKKSSTCLKNGGYDKKNAKIIMFEAKTSVLEGKKYIAKKTF
jgi:hypothetical protein